MVLTDTVHESQSIKGDDDPPTLVINQFTEIDTIIDLRLFLFSFHALGMELALCASNLREKSLSRSTAWTE